jgi:hypothetical protein
MNPPIKSRQLIGSDSSECGAPGDETSQYYYQEGNRLFVEQWGRITEADPNEVITELFLNLHALKNCTDPVDLSRSFKYNYLVEQLIARFKLQKWTATYSDRADCTIYATRRDKAMVKATSLGELKSLT